jgi:hypothetical protein
MVVTALVLLFAQTAVDLWMDDLSSRHPQVRAHAMERLLELGEEAAYALEHREFTDPESRSLALELLRTLRRPRCVLRAPRFVGANRPLVLVELIISNQRPEPISIEPYWVALNRRFVRNQRWNIVVPQHIGTVIVGHKLLRKGLKIPARSERIYTIPVATRLVGRAGLDVTVRYVGPDFELAAKSTIRVGKESLVDLRRRAYSNREADRSTAVLALQQELRARRQGRSFRDTLRLAARSPFRDVRRGIAVAIEKYGQRGDRHQIQIACTLAADRDSTVARIGHIALGRIYAPRTAIREVQRLAAKALARPDDVRSRMMVDLIGSWSIPDRRLFLAGLLGSSRSRIVHKQVASILRRDGIPVEPGANGLVPRSQIRNLSR